MAEKAKPVPDGFQTLTPHLTVRDAEKAIDFYQKAFGAEVRDKSYAPDDKKIIHASLKIGDSMLMLNDEFPEWGTVAPSATGGGTGIAIHVYVDNVDTIFDRAVSAGATVKMPLMDAFWGDRYGQSLFAKPISAYAQRLASCSFRISSWVMSRTSYAVPRLSSGHRRLNTPAGFAGRAGCCPWGP